MYPKLLTILIITMLSLIDAKNINNDHINLVSQYLVHKRIKLCYFISCWSNSDNIQIILHLNALGIRITIINADTEITEIFKQKKLTYYGFILDSSCSNFKDILLKKTNNFNFRLTYPWLIIGNNSQIWIELFKKIAIRTDSDIKYTTIIDKKNYQIMDIYNPGYNLGGTPIITQYGFYNNNLNIHQTESFYLKRKDLSNITVRSASVVLKENYSGTFEEYISDRRDKQFDTMSKFHYQLFILLQDIHKFTHNLTFCDKWFGNLPTGHDGGIAKLLYEDKIELSSTGGVQRPPRIDIFDYLMPSYHFRNPGAYNPLSNEFLKPFSTNSWFILLGIGLLISVFLKTFYDIENNIFHSKKQLSWASIFLVTLSAVVQQGSTIYPSQLGGRIVFIVLMIMSLLLYNYYTSTILSSLLSKPPLAFQTLDELAHSNLDIGVEEAPYTITWFLIINDSDVQYIYKHKVFPRGAQKMNFFTPEKGIAKVKQGGFAYHTQLDTGYPIIVRTFNQDEICDLSSMSMIPQSFAGFVMKKNSQFYELFHTSLRKARERGLVDRNSKIWESEKPKCLSNTRLIPVGINQTFIAFLCLMIGIGIGLFLLIVELLWVLLGLDSKFKKARKVEP